MKSIPDNLYKKIVEVSNEVKEKLRRKGVVIPTTNDDGSITVGHVRIVKQDTLGFVIMDKDGAIIVSRINLPQTAVLLANSIAITRNYNKDIFLKDQLYGSALFEETLTKRALAKKNKNIDHWDLMTTKNNIARAKKNFYKNEIQQTFLNFENSYK
jgi:hypothetical protein